MGARGALNLHSNAGDGFRSLEQETPRLIIAPV
jgi:hypothetical protein